MDDQQLAELSFWIRSYAAASENLRRNAIEAIRQLLQAFTRWYDAVAKRSFAEQAAHLSSVGENAIEGLASAYIGHSSAVIRDNGPVRVPTITRAPLRNGADPLVVWSRPIEVYQRQVSIGATEDRAFELALERGAQLVETNLMLVARDAEVKTLAKLHFSRYRRVIHPELSQGGTCGLCIAASTRVYKTSELLPLHEHCHCTVVGIEGDVDAGAILNEQDLGRLYGDVGTTDGRALKNTRYKVNEHGEYGPTLNRRGQSFRTPAKLGKNDPIGRAVAELDKLKPTLKLLEDKSARGVDVSDALAYQRERIAYLEHIIAAA